MVANKKRILAETKRLGTELLQSRAYVNNAPLLLSMLAASCSSSASAPTSAIAVASLTEALHCLQAFFVPLIRSGEFSASARKKAAENLLKGGRVGGEKGTEDGENDRAEAIYRSWVWDRYLEFSSTLVRIVAGHAIVPSFRIAALHSVMELVKNEVPGKFNNKLYFKLCSTLICSKGFSGNILGVFVSDYFKYPDVVYFTYSSIEQMSIKVNAKKLTGRTTVLARSEIMGVKCSVHDKIRNMFDVLVNLPTSASQEDQKTTDELLWGMTFFHKRQRSRLSKAWLSFLKLPLPLDIYKKVLAQLHKRVIPFLSNPILLSDFLTSSYNVGGLISVMALNGLFILITSHGLEYPDFYNKLYALLEPSIFVSKHRARFFELMDSSLKSSHLPAYLAAAFAKKLARLSLSAPPAGCLLVIAMVHNLLRRHPAINCLVHRDTRNTNTSGKETNTIKVADGRLGRDPFLASEPDTAKCNALESSLWEIETLRSHYCPAVSRFVASLETDLTVRRKTTEVAVSDFSSGSYSTIFAEEVSKRLKAVPLAFYQTVPTTLFPENPTDDFLGWRFGDNAVKEHNAEDGAVSHKHKNDHIASPVKPIRSDGESEQEHRNGHVASTCTLSNSKNESEQETVPPPSKKRK
ncbi:unnamed protein product [Sphagnum troendelagicum]|uniref:CCAAT-binding factor domain-containing protein n=1 Tax=Sphagnum troendelagicum TaxID=128251 RepID=A0ABP0U3N3_9BRYO